MKKTKILFTLFTYFFVIYFTVIITQKITKNTENTPNNPSNITKTEEIKKEETKPEPEVTRLSIGGRDENTGKCIDFYKRTDGELSLYGLPDFVKENKTAVDLLEKDCQMVYQTGHFDVTGDGIKEILLITEAIDCITCRANSLIIISEDTVIYDKQVSNAMFRPIPGKSNAFEIKEPIYFLQNGLCCPDKGTVKVMEYTKYPSFSLVDEYIENYKTKQYPTFVERKDYYEGSDKIQKPVPPVSMFGIVGSTEED